jgi:hypothetical protein
MSLVTRNVAGLTPGSAALVQQSSRRTFRPGTQCLSTGRKTLKLCARDARHIPGALEPCRVNSGPATHQHHKERRAAAVALDIGPQLVGLADPGGPEWPASLKLIRRTRRRGSSSLRSRCERGVTSVQCRLLHQLALAHAQVPHKVGTASPTRSQEVYFHM